MNNNRVVRGRRRVRGSAYVVPPTCKWSTGSCPSLHYACRIGDLERVQYLVDVLQSNIHESDEFDATPLYLAAMCGHANVCHYLLEKGAKCDEEGDTARIFYVALNPSIRSLLKTWSMTAAATQDVFLHGLWNLTKGNSEWGSHSNNVGETPISSTKSSHPDHCCFWETSETTYRLHNIILHAVCPKLLEFVVVCRSDHDHHSRISFGTNVPRHDKGEYHTLVATLLEYLYTGKCDWQGRSYVDLAETLAVWAHQLELMELHQTLQQSLELYRQQASRRPSQYTLQIRHNVKSKLKLLAQCVSQPSLTTTTHDDLSDSPSTMMVVVPFSDVTWTWGEDGDYYRWHVHSAILYHQSEFFQRAIQSGFRESQQSILDLTHMASQAHVLQLALQFLYCDSFVTTATPITESDSIVNTGGTSQSQHGVEVVSSLDVAVALIEFGSAILCARLCQYATQVGVIPRVNSNNVLELLQLSRLYQLERLEEKCVEVLAVSLHDWSESNELQQLLQEEIRQTTQEGEICVVDVPLAAEMRSYLHKALKHSRCTTESTTVSSTASKSSSLALERDTILTLLNALEVVVEKAIVAERGIGPLKHQ